VADASELIALLGRLDAARVACIGDLMLDEFVDGEVGRVSPEAPVPVLLVGGERTMPGGAGNVAMNLGALGVATRLTGIVGDDDAARRLTAHLEDSSTTALHLVQVAGRPTTVKTRFLANGQQLLRADRDSVSALPDAERDTLKKAALAAITGAGAVVLSDYGKGVLDGPTIKAIIAAAHDAKVPVIVDPKGTDYSRYRGADIVTPNRHELALASGHPSTGDDDIVAACRSLIDRCGVRGVLATLGDQGMKLVTPDEVHHLPVRALEVFDVVGAGDTVVAVLAAGLSVGADLPTAAALANAAAGLVVAKVGTAVVHPQELFAALQDSTLHMHEAKVMPLSVAIDRVQGWRSRGKRIGFTNGCFDLLHPGHVALLAQAKSECDRLVVGLNSDLSVRRLKGEGRPIQPQSSRAVVLAGLASVDAVVIFEEDTPLDLIKALRCDVLVKGADYTMDEVVGAPEVKSWGGRVVLADIVDGHSTTQTIERLAEHS